MALIARPLEVRPDGADSLDSDEPEVVVSDAAWERWNAGAVWCALDDLQGERRRLRLAIAPPHGVLELDGVRGLLPASAAPGWFWTVCGIWSSAPSLPAQDPVDWLDAVDAWAQGREPAGDALPPALRLRLGEGEEMARDEILLQHRGGWLRGRRYEVDGEAVVSIDEFSMKQLILDLSLLLALALTAD